MRVYFATDIHGSEKCFLKFLNAAKFYGAQVLILGGDITGKAMVPIVKEWNGSYRTAIHGQECIAFTEAEHKVLEKRVRFAGFYPFHATREELDELKHDEERVKAIFTRLTVESVSRWIDAAESKLKGAGIRCFIQPGNDDEMVVDDLLGQSAVVTNPDGRVIELPGGYLLASTGYANQTPWDCPRDLPETELQNRIAAILSRLGNVDTEGVIFNFHCPPYNTNIDFAPELDADLRPILSPGGQPKMAPAGSTSVRKAVEEYQPLLGLHGHIHESRGVARIGRTLCINPGSRYNEGILQGVIIDLEGNCVRNYQLTAG